MVSVVSGSPTQTPVFKSPTADQTPPTSSEINGKSIVSTSPGLRSIAQQEQRGLLGRLSDKVGFIGDVVGAVGDVVENFGEKATKITSAIENLPGKIVSAYTSAMKDTGKAIAGHVRDTGKYLADDSLLAAPFEYYADVVESLYNGTASVVDKGFKLAEPHLLPHHSKQIAKETSETVASFRQSEKEFKLLAKELDPQTQIDKIDGIVRKALERHARMLDKTALNIKAAAETAGKVQTGVDSAANSIGQSEVTAQVDADHKSEEIAATTPEEVKPADTITKVVEEDAPIVTACNDESLLQAQDVLADEATEHVEAAAATETAQPEDAPVGPEAKLAVKQLNVFEIAEQIEAMSNLFKDATHLSTITGLPIYSAVPNLAKLINETSVNFTQPLLDTVPIEIDNVAQPPVDVEKGLSSQVAAPVLSSAEKFNTELQKIIEAQDGKLARQDIIRALYRTAGGNEAKYDTAAFKLADELGLDMAALLKKKGKLALVDSKFATSSMLKKKIG